MLKTLFRWLPGFSARDAEGLERAAEAAGLHLKDVLDAHSAWKKRLERLLAAEQGAEIDLATVADDRICELGRWLHGEGRKRYGKLPEYHDAVKAHATFHKIAAEVVIEHQSGDVEGAARLLRGPFRHASNANQLALVSLFMAGRD